MQLVSDRSLRFYTEVLGMKGEVKWNTGAYTTLDSLWFCLSLGEVKPSKDYSHIAFTIATDKFDVFRQLITKHNMKQWQDNTSEGNSLYILDPDGHKLEIHCGNLTSRLLSLKRSPYQGLEYL
ncbi:VOC family protein [Thalassotalea euphylliae]|nr:VOC family protein [Thalassotalea euphylliae]